MMTNIISLVTVSENSLSVSSLVNPLTANSNCRLLCHLLVILNIIFCKQCEPLRSSLIWVHTVYLYTKIGLKSLQEYSADDINRRHFQMQVFLAF